MHPSALISSEVLKGVRPLGTNRPLSITDAVDVDAYDRIPAFDAAWRLRSLTLEQGERSEYAPPRDRCHR